MRIVHVVTAFPRREEDVITPWMVELLRRSRERGLAAEVLAPAYRGPPDESPWGIPVRRFRYAPAPLERLTHEEPVPDRLRRSPAHALLLPPYLAASVAAGWREGRGQPDVVHVHWPVPHALAGAAARLSSGGRSALVCSFYAVGINWVENRLPWMRPFLRWTMTTADTVTAISSHTALAVERISGREPRVVPFAAAVAPGPESGEAGDAPPALTGKGPLRLLFVGRLVERKGVEHLVRALARILTRRDAELVVVGEGSREPAIREAVREGGLERAVRFAGFLSREELSREYAAADIFVLPAVVDRRGDTEGLGVVLLEALRFERPVVASGVGGIPDIVEDGVTGWLVPPGDAEALARTILRVADRPEEARRVAGTGRERAEERFGWDRVLGDLAEVYREAIVARRRAGGRG